MPRLYGEILNDQVRQPFELAREEFVPVAQQQRESFTEHDRWLFDLVGRMTYDETAGHYLQTHPGVPGKDGKSVQTIQFPMYPREIDGLIKHMTRYIKGQPSQ